MLAGVSPPNCWHREIRVWGCKSHLSLMTHTMMLADDAKDIRFEDSHGLT